jgi:hypothetical protein
MTLSRKYYTRRARELGYTKTPLNKGTTKSYMKYVTNAEAQKVRVYTELKKIGFKDSQIPPTLPRMLDVYSMFGFTQRYPTDYRRRDAVRRNVLTSPVRNFLSRNIVYNHSYTMVKIHYSAARNEWRTLKSFTFKSKSPQDTALKAAIVAKLRQEQGYDEDDITEASIIDIKAEGHIVNMMKLADTIQEQRRKMNSNHFAAKPLNYVGWNAPEMKLGEEACGPHVCRTLFGMDIEEVSELLERPITEASGMTGEDFIKIAKYKFIPLIITDGVLNILNKNVEDLSHDNKITENTIVLILHNEHIYIPESDTADLIIRRASPEHIADAVDIENPGKSLESETHVYEDAGEALEFALSLNHRDGCIYRTTKAIAADKIAVRAEGALEVQNEKDRGAAEGEDLMNNKLFPLSTAATERQRVKEDKTSRRELRIMNIARRKQNIRTIKAATREKINILVAEEEASMNAKRVPANKTKHIIIVNAKNLTDIYTQQLEAGMVYPPKIYKEEVMEMKISSKARILARPQIDDIMQMAKDIGVVYTDQSMYSLLSQMFERIASQWEGSIFNPEVMEAVRFRKYGGINRFEDHTLTKDEHFAAVDVKRNYTAIAGKGDFYTIDYSAALIQEFTYDKNKTALYLVHAEHGYLFDGDGLYDYKVVRYGIESGEITEADLYGMINVNPSIKNDAILKQYIRDVYNQISNDDNRKIAVNYKIGDMGKTERRKPGRVIVATGQDELSYFNNVLGANTESMYFWNKEQPITHDDKFIFALTTDKTELMLSTDELIRLAIVQRGRMETHLYMKAVEASGFKVVGIKTDAIIYVSENKKLYEVNDMPSIGDLRWETTDQNVTQTYKTPPPQPEDIITYTPKANEWLTVVTASAEDDFNPADLMAYDRLFLEGAAGTGKSYTLNALAKLYKDKGLRVLMTSFTHSACNILTDGRTLHSTLGIKSDTEICPKTFGQTMDDYDVIIVDEASTIPTIAMRALGSWPINKKLILAGDFRQCKRITNNKNSSSDNLDNLLSFKTLCNHTKIIMRKQHRANPEYANQAIDYADGGDLPDGLVISPTMPIDTATQYITFSNAARVNTNRKVLDKARQELNITDQPLKDRRCRDIAHKDARNLYSDETFDRHKLMHILANKDIYAKQLFDSRSRNPEDCLVIAEKYLVNSMIKKKTDDRIGTKPVEYHQTGADTRYIPALSQGLATITRKIRHLIAGEFYDDLDLINAHPNILIQLCTSMNIETPCLSQYVNKRADIFDDLITAKYDRDYIKKMILATMNGGSKMYAEYTTSRGGQCPAWITQFRDETRDIHIAFKDQATDATYAQHLIARRAKGKYESSDLGSFMNKSLIKAEVQIMNVVMNVLSQRRMLTGFCLCSDGIMIRKQIGGGNPYTQSFYQNMTDSIRDITGFSVMLAIKPMTSELVLPEVLMPYECEDLTYINPKMYDEFTNVHVGLPVIATATMGLYHNNQTFTITKISDRGAQGVIKNGVVIRELSDKVLRSIKRDADRSATLAFKTNRNIKSITKKYKAEFDNVRRLVTREAIEAHGVATEGDGTFYTLTGDKVEIMISQGALMRWFNPAYAITSYKAQGRTLNGKVCILEFERMTRGDEYNIERNNAYVSLTRVVDPEMLTIVNGEGV